jgi:dTDP-4-dehydrorhamnose 3,5-epimerase
MTARLLTPRRFADARGWFAETWHTERYQEAGITANFCQDNQSFSRLSLTLRGLHFQRAPHAQAKLVRCLRGRIFDVAVDLRSASPTFMRWVGVELTAEIGNQLFIPAGFAHGFLTLEPDCEIAYKVDSYYAPQADGGIAWNDPQLAIEWPLVDGALPLLSDKDAELPGLNEADFDFPYDGNPLLPLEG